MQTSQFLSIFIIIFAMIFSCGSSWKYNSRCSKDNSCEGHCFDCEYGSVSSPICGFEVCAQGPDRYCDENEHLCGAGLTCQCHTCHGCSTIRLDRNCSTAPPCLHDSSLTTNELKRMIMKRILNQLE